MGSDPYLLGTAHGLFLGPNKLPDEHSSLESTLAHDKNINLKSSASDQKFDLKQK